MKTLLNGESGSRNVEIDLEKKEAKVTHCWKKDRDAQRYELTFTYKLDCTDEELARYALLWVNKDYQNRMRSENFTKSDLERQEAKPISIKEMYEKRERVADPFKRAASAVTKLSDAEKAELLKLLQES